MLFSSIHYTIASSIPAQRADQLRHVLDINGAHHLQLGLFDETLDTVITNSHRFEGWDKLSERPRVRVVSDKWVDKCLIMAKLQPVQYFSPDPAMLFSGVVACASDLPTTDLEVLSAGVTALGGQWRSGLTRDVTHLFVLNPDNNKYTTALHYKEETGIRIILPHWFDDAVRLGIGNLPTKPYEWPDPDLLKGADGLVSQSDNTNHVKAKGKAALSELEQNDVKRNMYATAVLFTPTMGRSSPPAESDISLVLNKVPRNTTDLADLDLNEIQVWKERKILLSRSLELHGNRFVAVQAGIERAGGTVVRYDGDDDEPELLFTHKSRVDKMSKKERVRRRNEAERVVDCDILVTRCRHGRAYVRACQTGKIIGTLAWLFHVQSSGVHSNPQDQLLHYPVPKQIVEAFSKHVITVTNYTGETREYIKKLIAAMGATFTPSMSGENTALIAAYLGGTKADKAHSWSIPIVNHTWLEDCFIQWRNLTMALEKYIVFPPGVDFSSLLGERGVGVGNQIANEAEDLAAIVFEEDEDYVSDVEENDGDNDELGTTTVLPPNGSESTGKVTGLADEDHDAETRTKSRSKSLTKKKPEVFQPPEGMDVDFEPPSTAVVSNHMDWNIDISADIQMDDGDQLPKSKKSSTAQSRKVANSRLEDQREVIPSTEDNRRMSVEEEEEEEEERPSVKSKVKPKVKRVPEEVIELDSEGERPQKQSTKGKDRASAVSDEEEEEETHVKSPKTTKPKAVSRMKPKEKRTPNSGVDEAQPKRSRVKSKPATLPDETPPKRKQAIASSSKLKGDETEEGGEEEESDAQGKSKTGLRRKTTVEVVMITPPRKKIKDQASDDGRLDKSKKAKSTPVSTPLPSTNKNAGVKSAGLLNKSKADARTRIKKKPPSRVQEDVSVESEEEENSPVKPKRTKRKIQQEEAEEDAEEEEESPPKKTRKSEPRAQAKSNTAPTKKSPYRKKPLHVYSTDGVESEDDNTSSNVFEVHEEEEEESDSDDELPEVPLPKKVSTRTSAKKTAPTRRESNTRKNEEQTLSAMRTPSRQANQSGDIAKRKMSVLSPALAMSSGSTKQRRRKNADDDEEEEDDDDVPLEEVERGTRKLKINAQISASDSESAEEKEVNEIVSPRRNPYKAKKTAAQPVSKGGRGKLKEQEVRKPAKAQQRVLDEVMAVDDAGSSPVSTTGHTRRHAATKAAQRLHDTLMPDVVNFEAQMKKSRGKNRQSVSSLSAFALEFEEEEREEVKKRKKVAQSGMEGRDGRSDEEEEEEEEPQPRKKRRVSAGDEKTSKIAVVAKGKGKGKQKVKEVSVEVESLNKPSSEVVLLTTQVTLTEDVLKSLAKLGVRMTTRPNECTHLLCPHLVRTEKFLCALQRAPFILSAKWAIDSAAAKKLLSEKDYILDDPAGEKKFEVKLSQALRRAKANKGKLLEGKTFYLTPRVGVDKKLLKSVVNACGGELANQTPSLRIVKAAPEKRFVISCKEDISMWRPIALEGYTVYSQELLLAGVMKQQMEWDREEFMMKP